MTDLASSDDPSEHTRVVRVITLEGSRRAVDHQLGRSLAPGTIDKTVVGLPIRLTITQGPLQPASVPDDWPTMLDAQRRAAAADRALQLHFALDAGARICVGPDGAVDLWWGVPSLCIRVLLSGTVVVLDGEKVVAGFTARMPVHVVAVRLRTFFASVPHAP